MKVSVNAVPMAGLLTGIARHLRNLYMEMEKIDDIEVVYLLRNKISKCMPALADTEKWQHRTDQLRKLPPSVLFGLRALEWYKYEYGLNRIACKPGNGIALHHETGFTPARFTKGPCVFSMYDLVLRRFKETQPAERVMLFEHFISKRLPQADHIIASCRFVRQEIIEEFKIAPGKVSAVPLAPDPVFSPASSDHVRDACRRLGLPNDYLLFVSALEPRKNIDLLVDALGIAKTDIPLVLVGWQGWGEKPWLEKVNNKEINNRFFFTGHLSDSDLKAVYSGATALIYPSIYEGFGLPILEAMACRCPVVCSNAASMPEAAGDAAILIDPFDADDLARAIDLIVNDSLVRHNLIAKGEQHAANFTWSRTAQKTAKVFKKVLL
ncbi:glycosyltransferase family 4 protein [Desulfobacter curvatus]|uniref:glycosyltransferase family 4 protein n=1 Tax=Desulfobacter curvatus TaxID=2290 RepID=UPI00039BE419|nr:glycosyltransferase family 1 protein [Desulfobacter curvatus]